MTNLLERIKKFLSYWYVRYLLVSELYMVEPWEKVVIQVIFGALFLLCWYFNHSLVMHGISHLRGTMTAVEPVS